MEQSEGDNEEENLEETAEDVTPRSGQQYEGKKGWKSSIEDSRSNVLNCSPHSLVSSSRLWEKPVSDVDRVVNTESNGNHEVVTGDRVYGDTPEVEESPDIDQGKQDTEDDDDGSLKVANE